MCLVRKPRLKMPFLLHEDTDSYLFQVNLHFNLDFLGLLSWVPSKLQSTYPYLILVKVWIFLSCLFLGSSIFTHKQNRKDWALCKQLLQLRFGEDFSLEADHEMVLICSPISTLNFINPWLCKPPTR